MVWVPQNGQRFRFFSKLGTDVVLAATLGRFANFPQSGPSDICCYVHRLANGPAPEATVFEVQMNDDGSFNLVLTQPTPLEPQILTLSWEDYDGYRLAPNLTGFTRFWADPLDPDPWIALNNYDRDHVVDVIESDISQGALINAFPWNGGDNQWWRPVGAD